MSEKSVRISLKAKMLFMVLTVVLTSNLVIGIMTYMVSSQNLTKSVYNHIESVSQDAANQIASINEKQLNSLRFLAELDIIKDETVPLEEKSRQFTGIVAALGGKYENVAFYDAEGNAITADGRLINMKTRAYFTEAMAGREYVSDPLFSPTVNAVLQSYSVPVRNKQGKPIGAMVMLIKGNAFIDIIQTIDLGGGMHPSVINHKERITVADASGKESDVNEKLEGEGELKTILNHIFEGKENIEAFTDPDTKKHLIVSYRNIPKTDWTVFAAAPYDYYFSGHTAMRNAILAVIIITIIVSAFVIAVLVTMLFRPLKEVKNSITTIASGNADLTQRLPEESNDEIGDVVKGFNNFVEKLQNIIKNLQSSKTTMSTAGEDMSATAQDTAAAISQIINNIEIVHKQITTQISEVANTSDSVNQISDRIQFFENMIENQTSGVSQASAAVEQMIGNISSVNQSVDKMAASFDSLRNDAQNGFNQQQDVNERIQQIEQQSAMLQDANSAISAIAEQTNLLAMNAAIEAAHAGEAGKGFSVVADEIRKLSETSTAQSKTIGDQLNKINESIQEVVAASQQSSKVFESVSYKINDTDQLVMQIKAAMQEQNSGSRQISEALQSMNDSTMEVRNASAEMSEGNKSVLDEIRILQNSTEVMKDSMDEMSSGARKISESGAALSDISEQVKNSIDQIGSQIDQFKV